MGLEVSHVGLRGVSHGVWGVLCGAEGVPLGPGGVWHGAGVSHMKRGWPHRGLGVSGMGLKGILHYLGGSHMGLGAYSELHSREGAWSKGLGLLQCRDCCIGGLLLHGGCTHSSGAACTRVPPRTGTPLLPCPAQWGAWGHRRAQGVPQPCPPTVQMGTTRTRTAMMGTMNLTWLCCPPCPWLCWGPPRPPW